MANVNNDSTSLLVEKIVTTITQLIKSTCQRARSSGYKLQFTEDERDSLKQTLQVLELQNTETVDERVSIIIKIINLLLDCTGDSDDEDNENETPSNKGCSIQDVLPILQALNSNFHNRNIDTSLLSNYNFKRKRGGNRNRHRGKSASRSRREKNNSKEERSSEHEVAGGRKEKQKLVESKHIYDFEVGENKMGSLLGKKGVNIEKARKIEGIDRIVINGNRCKIMGQNEEAVNEARSVLEFKDQKTFPKNDKPSTSTSIPKDRKAFPKNDKPSTSTNIPIQNLKISKDCEFEVQEDKMGLLLGKNGSNVESARKIEGIDEIKIIGNKCRIIGQSWEAVKEAKNMLQFREEKIFVEKNLVGKFIGKKGSMIEKLKSKSGLRRINVHDKEGTNNYQTKVAVSLIGSDENIKAAKKLINEFLELYGSSGNKFDFDSSPTIPLQNHSYDPTRTNYNPCPATTFQNHCYATSSSNFNSLQSTMRQEVRSPTYNFQSASYATSSSAAGLKHNPRSSKDYNPRSSNNKRSKKQDKSPSCCVL